jgi:hypothetical protein
MAISLLESDVKNHILKANENAYIITNLMEMRKIELDRQ